jgi:uncharacterized protein
LLPERLIPAWVNEGRVVPTFLGAGDLPWLGALLDETARFEGRPAHELERRLHEPLPLSPPLFQARAAAWLVQRFWRATVKSAIAPPLARVTTFTAAARAPGRDRALAEAADALGVTAGAVEESLFADLPGERIVHRPKEPPDAAALALRTNLLIARSLLQRAASVEITVDGELAPLVRLAKRKGLLSTVDAGPPARLRLSGPYALFRRTLLYGRALGDLLPALAAGPRFSLTAECLLRGSAGELRLSTDAPRLAPGSAAASAPWLDRLAGELSERGWTASTPDPVRAGDSLIFPDLLLRHADGSWFYLEVLGFWTPEHARRLLSRPIDNLILCADEERGCGDGEVGDPRLFRYRRRIDADALLAWRLGVDAERKSPAEVSLAREP